LSKGTGDNERSGKEKEGKNIETEILSLINPKNKKSSINRTFKFFYSLE